MLKNIFLKLIAICVTFTMIIIYLYFFKSKSKYFIIHDTNICTNSLKIETTTIMDMDNDLSDDNDNYLEFDITGESPFIKMNKSFDFEINFDSNIDDDIEKYYVFSCQLYKTLRKFLDIYYKRLREFNFFELHNKTK